MQDTGVGGLLETTRYFGYGFKYSFISYSGIYDVKMWHAKPAASAAPGGVFTV